VRKCEKLIPLSQQSESSKC